MEKYSLGTLFKESKLIEMFLHSIANVFISKFTLLGKNQYACIVVVHLLLVFAWPILYDFFSNVIGVRPELAADDAEAASGTAHEYLQDEAAGNVDNVYADLIILWNH